VVASIFIFPALSVDNAGVSIPFIAGQWSLPCARGAMDVRTAEFQSPSLRGSGRFLLAASVGSLTTSHVSIPFIAGQWSLRHSSARCAARFPLVSIPFIAGQWSLHCTESVIGR